MMQNGRSADRCERGTLGGVSGSVHLPREFPQSFDVVVIAASQGAVPLYRELFGRLDAELAAPVLLVQHRRPGEDLLVKLLARHAALAVQAPCETEPLHPRRLYVCPSDHQLRFSAPGRVTLAALAAGERVAADPVLASAAAVHGPRVLAVVLSGRLQDGASGVRAVKAAGGRVLAQDPQTAACPSMPAAALASGCVDASLPPHSIADAVNASVSVPGTAELFATRPSPWISGIGA